MASQLATPQDITRIGAIDDALVGGWSKVPVYYQYVLQLQLPLSQEEFDRIFARSIRLFVEQVNEECPGIQTNAELSAGFPEPFLLMGLGILAIGEDLSFSQAGTLASEDLLTSGSTAEPILEEGLTPAQVAAGYRPARLWYGGATWRFINKFFQSKRFVLRVGRCEIVNESLLEVGMVNQPPVFGGAGDSSLSTMPFVRETNDVMNGKRMDFKFVPSNTRFAAVALGPDQPPVGSPDSMVIGQVSEAQEASVTFGHPIIHNLANRIYCLPQPLLITPFTRVELEFETVDNDCCLIPAAQRAAMVRCETPFAESPQFVANGLPTEICTIPGGCISIGILLKGYTCLPRAVADFLLNYVCGSGYEQLYTESPYIAGIVDKYGLHEHKELRGFVGSLKASGALKS